MAVYQYVFFLYSLSLIMNYSNSTSLASFSPGPHFLFWPHQLGKGKSRPKTNPNSFGLRPSCCIGQTGLAALLYRSRGGSQVCKKFRWPTQVLGKTANWPCTRCQLQKQSSTHDACFKQRLIDSDCSKMGHSTAENTHTLLVSICWTSQYILNMMYFWSSKLQKSWLFGTP